MPRAKCLPLCLTILTIGLSGCAVTPPADVAIGCADPPVLIPFSQVMRDRTPNDIVDWMELTLGDTKSWGIENCRRIRAHDERFQ